MIPLQPPTWNHVPCSWHDSLMKGASATLRAESTPVRRANPALLKLIPQTLTDSVQLCQVISR
eukprot:2333450-Amphidinium_carterae.2